MIVKDEALSFKTLTRLILYNHFPLRYEISKSNVFGSEIGLLNNFHAQCIQFFFFLFSCFTSDMLSKYSPPYFTFQ